MIEISCVGKPFVCEARGRYRFAVDDDGAVWAWDSIAACYTILHRLSPRAQARIRAIARWSTR